MERKAEAARIRKLKNDISKVEEQIKKYEDRLNAVSYTHLDVYKRQIVIHSSTVSEGWEINLATAKSSL